MCLQILQTHMKPHLSPTPTTTKTGNRYTEQNSMTKFFRNGFRHTKTTKNGQNRLCSILTNTSVSNDVLSNSCIEFESVTG